MNILRPPSGTRVTVNRRNIRVRAGAADDIYVPPPPTPPDPLFSASFSGWLQDPHPVTRKDEYGLNNKLLAVRPWCLRAFLFKDAYRTEGTWVLPELTQALRINPSGEAVSSTARPYVTSCWGWSPEWETLGLWSGTEFRLDGTELLDFDGALTGANVFRVASETPGVLDVVTPGVLHDVLVVGEQYCLVDRSVRPNQKLSPANQYVTVTVCAPAE